MKEQFIKQLTQAEVQLKEIPTDDFAFKTNKTPAMDYKTDIQEALEPLLGRKLSIKFALSMVIVTNKYEQELSEAFCKLILTSLQKVKDAHLQIDLLKEIPFEDAIMTQISNFHLDYRV